MNLPLDWRELHGPGVPTAEASRIWVCLVRSADLACRTESSSCAVSELLNTDERGQAVALEHRRLKRRTPCAE